MLRWIFTCIVIVLITQSAWADEQKVLDRFPSYSQGKTAWCAWVSAQMVLDYYGYKVSPEDVAAETFRLAGQTWGGKDKDLLPGEYKKFYDNAIKSLSNNNLSVEKIEAQSKDDLLYKIFDAIDRGYPIILESNGPWLYDATDIPAALSWWFTPESSWPSGGHASVIVGYSLKHEYNIIKPLSFKFIANLIDNPPVIKIHDPAATAAFGSGTYWVSYDKLFEKIIGNASSTRLIIIKPSPVNNILPTVLAFNVTPLSLISGKSLAISYIVADNGGIGLKQVELWRKDESSDWQQISINTLAGETAPLTGTFTDSPAAPGKYWYSIVVVDNAGNWDIPNSFEPAEVEVVGSALPTVQAFQVTPQSLNVGGSFTIDYTVSDISDLGLKQVELWRKDESSDWQEINTNALAGETGPISGSFTDSPSSPGKYWYGVHVVSNAGNWNDEKNSNTNNEPSVYGPAEVEVKDDQLVTLTLYVHDGDANGPIIPDALIIGQDGSGNDFRETANDEGYVTINREAGTWSFSASADGYETNSWDQEITETDTKDAFLQKAEVQKDSPESIAPATEGFESSVVGKWMAHEVATSYATYPNGVTTPVTEEYANCVMTFYEDGTFAISDCEFCSNGTCHAGPNDIACPGTANGEWIQNADTIRLQYESGSAELTLNGDTMTWTTVCDFYKKYGQTDDATVHWKMEWSAERISAVDLGNLDEDISDVQSAED